MMGIFILLFLFQIKIGPYLNWDDSTSTSIRINWRTENPDSSILLYGINSLTDTLKDTILTQIHTFKLTGLTPNQKYIYKIEGTGYSSPLHSFHTSPQSADTITFVVFGDTRSDSTAHQMVVDSITGRSPGFVIHTGDLVANGGNLNEWQTFFNIEKNLLPVAPFMPCIGNHESPFDLYFEFFYLPENEEYYSFEYGNIFFIVLNTEDISSYYIQRVYLDQKLNQVAQDSTKWIIVYFHQPPYSAGGHGSNLLVRQAWCDVLENYQVPLVFNGHNHFYQRTTPINGVRYIITGGGGAPLYDPDSTGWIAYSEKCYHFCFLTATDLKLCVKAIRATDGVVIDSICFEKPWIYVKEVRIKYAKKIESLESTGIYDINGRVISRNISFLPNAGIYFVSDRGKNIRKIFVLR